ncbi:hypothetical protein BREVUG8_110444 [Brevundimonas sp. G8]|nr:hypothetical protein BREVUG8_110444 [Brevundimonas sp. G8]
MIVIVKEWLGTVRLNSHSPLPTDKY